MQINIPIVAILEVNQWEVGTAFRAFSIKALLFNHLVVVNACVVPRRWKKVCLGKPKLFVCGRTWMYESISGMNIIILPLQCHAYRKQPPQGNNHCISFIHCCRQPSTNRRSNKGASLASKRGPST